MLAAPPGALLRPSCIVDGHAAGSGGRSAAEACDSGKESAMLISNATGMSLREGRTDLLTTCVAKRLAGFLTINEPVFVNMQTTVCASGAHKNDRLVIGLLNDGH